MKIVFMGTPEYAVKTLEGIITAGHEVVAVFAQPDKPVGRKQILTPPPVKVCAESHGIPVYQPATLKDGKTEELLRRLAPDVIAVVAYGKILPESILSIPEYGCVNAHASLLPRHRGASPIQWAIVCGDKETGITTMLMDKGMDTGDILEVCKTGIGAEETADDLFARLASMSAELMVSTLEKLGKNQLTPKKQPQEGATYAPIIKKEMALLDFTKPAQRLYNEVRGFYSWPCAYFMLDGKRVKVIKAAVGEGTNAAPGTVIASRDELEVACGNGSSLRMLTVQPEGGRPMTSGQMLCGKKIPAGKII